MDVISTSPVGVIGFLGILSILPIIFIMTTSFIKVSMVLILTRESLGVQQIPPNIVIYSLSLILSFYVMGPVYKTTTQSLMQDLQSNNLSSEALIKDLTNSSASVTDFLKKHAPADQQEFFYKSLKQFWTPEMMAHVTKNDLIILVPAFMVSELMQAFKIGFLIYLPSVMIDIIVSNILMAMGMMMMSPVTISLPIKLLLFIALDGWSRLIHALLGSYL
ncbi:MAG: type III secretion system export apparatus subunit SctR [Neisseriaceae bacterium]